MNQSEIELCVINAKQGNRLDMQKILEQYKPFIFKTAKGFNIKNYDMNDLVQIGYIALINAVKKYTACSNTFSSYAYTSIKNTLKYTARQNSKYNGELSLNIQLNQGNTSDTEFVDTLEAADNLEAGVLKSEEILEITQALSNLSPEEAELVHMLYYRKSSIKAYAEKKEIGYIKAVRNKNKVLEKLNCYLN